MLVTVTVTFWFAVPPVPVQESVYVPVAVRLVSVCVPDVALVPDHALDAVQEVALVELHVNVADPPEVTDVGEADKVTVGAEAEGGGGLPPPEESL